MISFKDKKLEDGQCDFLRKCANCCSYSLVKQEDNINVYMEILQVALQSPNMEREALHKSL